jgi:hypothetical protein
MDFVVRKEENASECIFRAIRPDAADLRDFRQTQCSPSSTVRRPVEAAKLGEIRKFDRD